MPSHSSLRVLMPNRRLKQRVNSGTVATITAAMPEGTCWCSATVTQPLPTAKQKHADEGGVERRAQFWQPVAAKQQDAHQQRASKHKARTREG
ncbi:Uncharacterised protein [Cedecea neteri]|uniref:Uncharacterized protein n=1 Tax=Cedecea neteri TaxID=158822 RepID=A0A2X3J798_9ENTR|nr:Uncharacterised protein [Cedecea neteri]